MQRKGVSNLPLHGGHAPRWLFNRMTELAGAITDVVVKAWTLLIRWKRKRLPKDSPGNRKSGRHLQFKDGFR